jgi:hypothetical protein
LSLALGLIPSPAAHAQQRGNQLDNRAWAVALTVAHNSFDGASRDTVSVPGTEVSLRPGDRLGITATLSRRIGRWDLGLGLGYLSTHLLADGETLELRDKSEPWRRLRAEVLLAYRLVTFSQGALALGAGPTIDGWDTSSFDGRIVAGGQVRLSLDLTIAGRFTLLNQASLGWSGSPFTDQDVPSGAEQKTLRTLTLGSGLKVGL